MHGKLAAAAFTSVLLVPTGGAVAHESRTASGFQRTVASPTAVISSSVSLPPGNPDRVRLRHHAARD